MKKKTRKKKDDNSDNDAEQENKPQVNGNVRTLENMDFQDSGEHGFVNFMYCPFFDPKQFGGNFAENVSFWGLRQVIQSRNRLFR